MGPLREKKEDTSISYYLEDSASNSLNQPLVSRHSTSGQDHFVVLQLLHAGFEQQLPVVLQHCASHRKSVWVLAAQSK